MAGATKWADWKGLPGHANLFVHLRNEADWKSTPVTKSDKSRGEVAPALAAAAKKISATYEMPFMKHAPIGPTMAVADARADGTVFVYTHNQNPQALRGELAQMLSVGIDSVVVRTFPGAGHYGRSNGGNAGAEDEAVILSKAVGKPVRVQWMRPEDFQWSTQSPAAYSDVEVSLDAKGRMSAYRIDHYMPTMQDDRPVGAVLAGLPTMPAPDVKAPPDSIATTANGIADPWLYDGVSNLMERGHGTDYSAAAGIGCATTERTPVVMRTIRADGSQRAAASRGRSDPVSHRSRRRAISASGAMRRWEARPRRTSAGRPARAGGGVSAMPVRDVLGADIGDAATGAIR